jgi:hypothetical protein
MNFEQWKRELANELEIQLAMLPGDGAAYIKATGDECWREMFDDGLSPADAAEQEASASAH